MRTVVTGAAGFIGSHLVERLLSDGHDVVGLDRFSDYYDPAAKRRNLRTALGSPRFELLELDLASADLKEVLQGCDVVFHLAAQPGVRLSWSDEFSTYDRDNVLATQRLLEAARAEGVGRVVYASSSSVYGNAGRYPTEETDLPRPHSPYGVTKLAAEHLCRLYTANFGLSTIALRYFTVFGPRQRPDMSIERLIVSALTGASFPLFGDGSYVREFTYVADIVEANLLAATAPLGEDAPVVNIAGGSSIAIAELVELVGELVGKPISLDRRPPAAGDVVRNAGSTALAGRLLGWSPRVDLRDGLAAQISQR